MCIKRVTLYWRQKSITEAIRASVNKQVDTFANEAPEHTAEIVLALLETTDEEGRIRSRAITESSVVSSTALAFSSA